MKKDKLLKKALLEASKWEEQATEFEKSTIPYSEARQYVLDRIYQKYKNEIIKK